MVLLLRIHSLPRSLQLLATVFLSPSHTHPSMPIDRRTLNLNIITHILNNSILGIMYKSIMYLHRTMNCLVINILQARRNDLILPTITSSTILDMLPTERMSYRITPLHLLVLLLMAICKQAFTARI